jgi:hypothetical protein
MVDQIDNLCKGNWVTYGIPVLNTLVLLYLDYHQVRIWL